MQVAEPVMSPTDPVAPAATSRWSISILAVAACVVVTTEFLIVGLIPALSRDLAVSTAVAGQLVTLFAFTVMLFGPVLTAVVAHVDRKRLFTIILLIFAGSNALAAVAPNLWVLAVARFVPALALPVFWGTASDTASRIAGPARAGRAVSQVYLGISGALLFGIPLGTLGANAFGWRDSFWGLAALSLVMAALIATCMPLTGRPERQPLADQLGILKDRRFVANVVLSVIVFTAMFTAYTYLADLLERMAGVAPLQVGWWLMGFGTIGLVGNWLGGRVVERGPLAATAAFTAVLGVAMVASVLTAHTVLPFVVALAVWAIAYTALFPVCQIRVMKAGGRAQALAGTLNVSAANAGIGLGAVFGGVTITQVGLASVGYVAAVVAGIALVAVVIVRRMCPTGPSTRPGTGALAAS